MLPNKCIVTQRTRQQTKSKIKVIHTHTHMHTKKINSNRKCILVYL